MSHQYVIETGRYLPSDLAYRQNMTGSSSYYLFHHGVIVCLRFILRLLSMAVRELLKKNYWHIYAHVLREDNSSCGARDFALAN